MEKAFREDLETVFFEKKFIASDASCWIGFRTFESAFFEERDYFFFRCILIGVTTEPVFDIRHKAHPTERMIVSYIGDRVYEIKCESDDVISGIEGFDNVLFDATAFVVDFFSRQPETRSAFHESLIVIVESDIELPIRSY